MKIGLIVILCFACVILLLTIRPDIPNDDQVWKAQQLQTKERIKLIESALYLFKLDYGEYPTKEQGLKILMQKTNDEKYRIKSCEQGYIEHKRFLTDSWGKDFIYIIPGEFGNYDIISYGADGLRGGQGKDKDIGNWEIKD